MPDGAYTAKVELDGGPYLGRLEGERTIQIKNPSGNWIGVSRSCLRTLSRGGRVIWIRSKRKKNAMRIFIHTDLEGISGIDSMEMIEPAHPRRREANELLMADVNAAVAGAFKGGATHVTVLDKHTGGGNFIVELLDRRAENDTTERANWSGKMDRSYAGTFFIGAHAMAGTQNGFLDHMKMDGWHNFWLNGRRIGELGMWATFAGNFGIPMLMVSGDEAACVEARQFFSPVETATVKRGVGRNRAELVPLEEARGRIREAARRAISLVGRARPFLPSKPMEIRLELDRCDYCDRLAGKPGNERLGPRVIRRVTSDPLDIFP